MGRPSLIMAEARAEAGEITGFGVTRPAIYWHLGKDIVAAAL